MRNCVAEYLEDEAVAQVCVIVFGVRTANSCGALMGFGAKCAGLVW